MVNGQLRCLGSATHLKNTFGQGLELDIKLANPTQPEIAALAAAAGHLGWAGGVGRGGRPLTAGDLQAGCSAVAKAAAAMAASGSGPQLPPSPGGRAVAGQPPLMGGVPRGASGLLPFDLRPLQQSLLEGGGDGGAVCSTATCSLLCGWWLAEAAVARVDAALQAAFPAGCALLERPSAASLRYRVLPGGGATAGSGAGDLGQVFRVMEGLKQKQHGQEREQVRELAAANQSSDGLDAARSLLPGGGGDEEPGAAEGLVSEYSVGQTTLEQIFNHFASSQENPEMQD